MEHLNELALFAGAGGGILGGKLLGWKTVCAVEREPYAASVLAARQSDGLLPPFPIWDDVCTFNGRPWRGIVDVVSGGFPCQDISAAGKGAGIDGTRSGLWKEMARIIREVGPRFAFVENSPMLTSRGLGQVLGDLAAMGYDAKWCVLGAADVGAPHQRDRIWIVAQCRNVADSDCLRGDKDSGDCELRTGGTQQSSEDSRISDPRQNAEKEMDYTDRPQRSGIWIPGRVQSSDANACRISEWWSHDPADASQSSVGRVAHGVAARVDRLKAIGNGQVPAVAATAWKILTQNTR